MAVGNTFGATALSSYGGFWIAYGTLFHPHFNIFESNHLVDGEPVLVYTPEERYSGVGFFLTGWFIFTTLLLLCTLKSTVMFFLLFFTLDLAFLFLACENYAGSMGNETARVALQKTGGVFGMFAAFLAWYNALAGIQDNRYVSGGDARCFLIGRLTRRAATRSSRCPCSPCPGPTRPRPTAPPSSSTPPKEYPGGAVRMRSPRERPLSCPGLAMPAWLNDLRTLRQLMLRNDTPSARIKERIGARGAAGLERFDSS